MSNTQPFPQPAHTCTNPAAAEFDVTPHVSFSNPRYRAWHCRGCHRFWLELDGQCREIVKDAQGKEIDPFTGKVGQWSEPLASRFG